MVYMNREFIRKMMQAKKLEYEAVKDIMPESFKNTMDDCKREIFQYIQNGVINYWKENQSSESNTSSKVNETACEPDKLKTTHKVHVEFK